MAKSGMIKTGAKTAAIKTGKTKAGETKAGETEIKSYVWALSCDMRDGKQPLQKAIQVALGTPLPRVDETMHVDLGQPGGETEAVVKKVSHRVVGDSVIPLIEMRRVKAR